MASTDRTFELHRLTGLLLVLSLFTIGCNQKHYVAPIDAPADFHFAFFAKNPHGVNSPAGNMIVILEPDGALRAATGPGCTKDTYPDPCIKLRREHMQHLYTLIREAGLVNQSQNTLRDDTRRSYQVDVTIDGRLFQNHLAIEDEMDKQTDELELAANLESIDSLHEDLLILLYRIERFGRFYDQTKP